MSLKPVFPFSIEAFIVAISNNKVTSVENALCLIPEIIRYNAVLMNNSQSLQNGSMTSPRAIMFDPGSAIRHQVTGSEQLLNGEMLPYADFLGHFLTSTALFHHPVLVAPIGVDQMQMVSNRMERLDRIGSFFRTVNFLMITIS